MYPNSVVLFDDANQTTMDDCSHLGNLWKKSPFFNQNSLIIQDEFEFTCTKLLERMEKILATVQLEKLNVENLHHELNDELKEFNEISNELFGKVESLTSLSNIYYCVNNNLKSFVEDISFRCQEAKEEDFHYHRVRISTQSFMKRVQIDADEMEMMLQFSICFCNQQCIEKGSYIWKEIYRLIDIIGDCEQQVQLLMPIRDIAPRYCNLISLINNFVNDNEFIPYNRKCDETAVFFCVSKLLTGELLGHEAMDPNIVLKTNAPKRPIFITRITKRNMNTYSLKHL